MLELVDPRGFLVCTVHTLTDLITLSVAGCCAASNRCDNERLDLPNKEGRGRGLGRRKQTVHFTRETSAGIDKTGGS
jgi:hypothetical protein